MLIDLSERLTGVFLGGRRMYTEEKVKKSWNSKESILIRNSERFEFDVSELDTNTKKALKNEFMKKYGLVANCINEDTMHVANYHNFMIRIDKFIEI